MTVGDATRYRWCTPWLPAPTRTPRRPWRRRRRRPSPVAPWPPWQPRRRRGWRPAAAAAARWRTAGRRRRRRGFTWRQGCSYQEGRRRGPRRTTTSGYDSRGRYRYMKPVLNLEGGLHYRTSIVPCVALPAFEVEAPLPCTDRGPLPHTPPSPCFFHCTRASSVPPWHLPHNPAPEQPAQGNPFRQTSDTVSGFTWIQVLGSLREEVQSLTRRLTAAQDAEARLAAQLTVGVGGKGRRRRGSGDTKGPYCNRAGQVTGTPQL